MKSAIKILALGAALAASATMAKADSLKGQITLTGGSTSNYSGGTFYFESQPLAVTFQDVVNNFSTTPGQTVTTSSIGGPITFGSSYVSVGNQINWQSPSSFYGDTIFTMTDGGNTLTFVLDSAKGSIDSTTKDLSIIGTGTFEGDGYDNTVYDFNLTDVNGSFQINTFLAPAPEPSSLLLLGSGLLGAAGIARRRFTKHSA